MDRIRQKEDSMFICFRLSGCMNTLSEQIGEKIVNQPLPFDLPVWETVSDECKSLLKGMLEKDQDRRMTIEEVLAHPWIQNNSAVNR